MVIRKIISEIKSENHEKSIYLEFVVIVTKVEKLQLGRITPGHLFFRSLTHSILATTIVVGKNML